MQVHHYSTTALSSHLGGSGLCSSIKGHSLISTSSVGQDQSSKHEGKAKLSFHTDFYPKPAKSDKVRRQQLPISNQSLGSDKWLQKEGAKSEPELQKLTKGTALLALSEKHTDDNLKSLMSNKVFSEQL